MIPIPSVRWQSTFNIFITSTENCLWGEWQETWSDCNVPCGVGSRNKTRNKVQEASETPKGDICVGSGVQFKRCYEIPCPGNISNQISPKMIQCQLNCKKLLTYL